MAFYPILSSLHEKFARGAYSLCFLCIIADDVLDNKRFNADKRIKGIQKGDHKIKIVKFAVNTTILLRDIICLDRLKVILKLYKDASSSKISFSKSEASEKLSLKYLKSTLVTILNNSEWDKINEGIAKKSITRTER